MGPLIETTSSFHMRKRRLSL